MKTQELCALSGLGGDGDGRGGGRGDMSAATASASDARHTCGLVVDCEGVWKDTLTARDLAEGDCRMQYARAPRYQRAMG